MAYSQTASASQILRKTPYDLADHRGFGSPDRLHRLVLGLQPDVVVFAEEALDRGLLADQGDDDLAVGGIVGRAHDDVVALEDAGFDHRSRRAR